MEPAKPPETKIPTKPRVFVDADVLFAGAASPNEHSASNLILRMGELTLIEAFASTQVVTEAERNLQDKLPGALPAFRLLASRCLVTVEDPEPTDLHGYSGLADPEDLPILAAAIQQNCSFLATFNIRHYQLGHPNVTVLKPGDMVLRIRYLLEHLSD